MSYNNEDKTVNYTNFPNIVIDGGFNVVAFNQMAFDAIKIFLSVELKKGNSVFDYINPENHEKAKGFMIEAFKGNFIRDIFSTRHTNGIIVHWEYYYQPVYSGSNKIEAVSISAIDTTELKNKEIALRDSEARYKGIVETQYDLVVRLDLKGKLTFANQRMCEVLGKTYEEVIGSDYVESIHPDDVKYVTEQFGRIMSPPYRTSGEVRGMTVDGWRWYHWESVGIRNDKGELSEVQGVCRDITEYKNAILNLAETNELLSAIMNSSPIALIVYNFEGNVTYWSKGAEKIFGWTEKEVLNKNPLMPEPEKDIANLRLNSLKKKSSIEIQHFQRFRKDGTPVVLNGVGVPLKNNSGEIIAALGIYEDITDKVNTEIENLKLSSVLNLSTGAIAILNNHLEIESVNPKFLELTGYSFEELKGMTLKDIRSPQMSLDEYYKLESNIKSGTEWKSESVNRSRKGNIYYENILISPIKDSTGIIRNYLLIKEDISERNKALQELINTRLRLGTIMNSLPNLVIFEFTDQITFLSVNIKDVMGYPRESFIEKPYLYMTIFDKEDLSKVAGKYREWFDSDTGDIFSGTMRYRKPDNSTAWIEIFLTKTKNENGVSIYGVAMDITESKKSEEKLIWNETLLRAMTESTRYGYYAVDLLTGGILYVNEKFCDMWGISSAYGDIKERKLKDAEVTAMCSKSVFDANNFQLTIVKYSDPSNSITFEDEVEMVSGRILRRFSSLLNNITGESIGRFYLYEDITEKKLYEKMSDIQNDYKLLIEEYIDSMVITDIKGDIKVVNTKLCNLTGFNKNELVTLSFFDLFVNPDVNDIRVYPQDSFDGKTVIRQKIIKRKDGTSLNVETRSKMLPNKLIQIILSEVDKTEANLSKYRDDGILNIYVNILTKLRLFRHGENSLSCLNRISLFLKNPDYLMKAGTGSVTTEIKQRFFSLAEEFDSSVNPQLDHIVTLISNLLIDSPNPEFQEQLLNIKNDISGNTKTLKTNLLELYSYIRDEKSVIDLNAVKNEILTSLSNIKRKIRILTGLLEGVYVTDAGDSLRKTVKKFSDTHYKVDIKADVNAAEPRIIFNKLEFTELLNILLLNSVEAAGIMKKTLKININLSSAKGKTVITYTDNGKGIPVKIKDRIFESGVSTKGKDRGFGLNFAEKVMNKYGGRIMLDSTSGSGVKFVMELNPY